VLWLLDAPAVAAGASSTNAHAPASGARLLLPPGSTTGAPAAAFAAAAAGRLRTSKADGGAPAAAAVLGQNRLLLLPPPRGCAATLQGAPMTGTGRGRGARELGGSPQLLPAPVPAVALPGPPSWSSAAKLAV
jgi:hypothetical protein